MIIKSKYEFMKDQSIHQSKTKINHCVNPSWQLILLITQLNVKHANGHIDVAI